MKKSNNNVKVKPSVSPNFDDEDFIDDDMCSTGQCTKHKLYYTAVFI